MTLWLVVFFRASTIARPSLPVPPATVMMAIVGIVFEEIE
jgi:hypothetical protein